jgi:hypothetical protein
LVCLEEEGAAAAAADAATGETEGSSMGGFQMNLDDELSFDVVCFKEPRPTYSTFLPHLCRLWQK